MKQGKPNRFEVGQRIDNERKLLNLSFSMMGERIGISKSTLNSWVRGLALPPEHKLHRISVLTNKPYEWFLWGEKAKFNDCSQCGTKTEFERCISCRSSIYNELKGIYNIIEHKDFPLVLNRKHDILNHLSDELNELKLRKSCL